MRGPRNTISPTCNSGNASPSWPITRSSPSSGRPHDAMRFDARPARAGTARPSRTRTSTSTSSTGMPSPYFVMVTPPSASPYTEYTTVGSRPRGAPKATKRSTTSGSIISIEKHTPLRFDKSMPLAWGPAARTAASQADDDVTVVVASVSVNSRNHSAGSRAKRSGGRTCASLPVTIGSVTSCRPDAWKNGCQVRRRSTSTHRAPAVLPDVHAMSATSSGCTCGSDGRAARASSGSDQSRASDGDTWGRRRGSPTTTSQPIWLTSRSSCSAKARLSRMRTGTGSGTRAAPDNQVAQATSTHAGSFRPSTPTMSPRSTPHDWSCAARASDRSRTASSSSTTSPPARWNVILPVPAREPASNASPSVVTASATVGALGVDQRGERVDAGEVLHHEVVVVERDVEGVLHERDELLESQRVEYACRQRIAGDGMVGQLLHVALDPAGGVHALAPSATARAIHLVVRSTVSSCDRSVGLRWIVVSST